MVRSRRPGERFGDGADAAGELLAVRGQGACPVGARGQEGDAGDVLELADLLLMRPELSGQPING